MLSAPGQDGAPDVLEPAHAPIDEPPTALPALTSAWADTFPELSRTARPRSTPDPRLLVLNDQVARNLDLDPRLLRTDAGLRFLTGESRAPGSRPVAQVYAGHQWGVFRPLLGDGRAALLGERRDRTGSLRDIHAKGIGPTSMSRVDGFATVGPMLREFVLGEAMHALRVPTTRALAVVATGAPRSRDGEVLPGAVLTRVASSHIRYGTFEYASARGDRPLLQRLIDHVTHRHYPHLVGDPDPARALLTAIVAASADQTARWMGVGFVHGVLSTDNVLVSAETIDYGPCAFLDAYDPDAVFSSIDREGRYAHGRQPEIMRWNLGRLGAALSIVLADDPSRGRSVAEEIVSTFDGLYVDAWTEVFRAKLGFGPAVSPSTVRALAEDALSVDPRRPSPRLHALLAASGNGNRRRSVRGAAKSLGTCRVGDRCVGHSLVGPRTGCRANRGDEPDLRPAKPRRGRDPNGRRSGRPAPGRRTHRGAADPVSRARHVPGHTARVDPRRRRDTVRDLLRHMIRGCRRDPADRHHPRD
jgi:uncharacterized protein YdiU (UPF0061 family)